MYLLSERLSSASVTCGCTRCLSRRGLSRIASTLGRRGSRFTRRAGQTLGRALLCYYFATSLLVSLAFGTVWESIQFVSHSSEVIEVLAFTRAFVVKRVGEVSKKGQDAFKGVPQKERMGQVSWKKNGGAAKAWVLAKKRANFI